jgi:hypothetical protein
VAVAGVLAAVALVAWFLLTLDRGAQFLVPGRHVVELGQPGKYLVWNDYRTVFRGRSYDESEALPSGVRIRVLERASGRPLEVSSSYRATSSFGNTSSVAVSQFRVEHPGSYEIVVEGNFPPRVFSVGRDFLFGLLGVILGAFALLLGGLGAAIGIAAWVFIRREEARERERRAAAPAAVSPQMPAGERSLKNIAALSTNRCG